MSWCRLFQKLVRLRKGDLPSISSIDFANFCPDDFLAVRAVNVDGRVAHLVEGDDHSWAAFGYGLDLGCGCVVVGI